MSRGPDLVRPTAGEGARAPPEARYGSLHRRPGPTRPAAGAGRRPPPAPPDETATSSGGVRHRLAAARHRPRPPAWLLAPPATSAGDGPAPPRGRAGAGGRGGGPGAAPPSPRTRPPGAPGRGRGAPPGQRRGGVPVCRPDPRWRPAAPGGGAPTRTGPAGDGRGPCAPRGGGDPPGPGTGVDLARRSRLHRARRPAQARFRATCATGRRDRGALRAARRHGHRHDRHRRPGRFAPESLPREVPGGHADPSFDPHDLLTGERPGR